MKSVRLFPLLLVGFAAASGCGKSGSTAQPTVGHFEPAEAQPRLATVQLWLGPEQLTAEVAATPRQIITGMMFRTNMAPNEGMIFLLGPPQRAQFWMKNCYVPLSVAYIALDGVILEIHDLQPQNTNTVDSASESVSFALETPQGWFQRHNLREGVKIRTEHGSLMETFGPRP